jgi:hypothetical protein
MLEEWVDGRMEGWKNGRMDDKAQNMVLYRTGHPLVKASIVAIDLEMRSLAAAEPDEDLNIGLGRDQKSSHCPARR